MAAPLQAKKKKRGDQGKTAGEEDINVSLKVCRAAEVCKIINDTYPCKCHMSGLN
jgi:hypothetical protein